VKVDDFSPGDFFRCVNVSENDVYMVIQRNAWSLRLDEADIAKRFQCAVICVYSDRGERGELYRCDRGSENVVKMSPVVSREHNVVTAAEVGTGEFACCDRIDDVIIAHRSFCPTSGPSLGPSLFRMFFGSKGDVIMLPGDVKMTLLEVDFEDSFDEALPDGKTIPSEVMEVATVLNK